MMVVIYWSSTLDVYSLDLAILCYYSFMMAPDRLVHFGRDGARAESAFIAASLFSTYSSLVFATDFFLLYLFASMILKA